MKSSSSFPFMRLLITRTAVAKTRCKAQTLCSFPSIPPPTAPPGQPPKHAQNYTRPDQIENSSPNLSSPLFQAFPQFNCKSMHRKPGFILLDSCSCWPNQNVIFLFFWMSFKSLLLLLMSYCIHCSLSSEVSHQRNLPVKRIPQALLRLPLHLHLTQIHITHLRCAKSTALAWQR